MTFLPDRSKVVTRHLLERYAAELPDRRCMIFEDGEVWTYQEALKQAYRAADKLSEIGISREENTLVFLPNGQDWIRSWWGIVSLGAVMVPVNTAYKGEMLRHICLDSQAKHIITTADLAERLEALGLNLNIIDPSVLTEGSSNETALAEPIEPWDIEAIIYTSGTTGPSKGVIVPYLHLHMSGIQTWCRATVDDTFLVVIPLFHMAALLVVRALWSKGGCIALQKVFSGSRFFEIVKKTGATMGGLAGSMADYLLSTPRRPNDTDNPLRVLGGQSFNDPRAFMERFGLEGMYGAYNMTETSCPIMTQGPVPVPKSSGRVRPGIEVRLVDDHDIPVPDGEVGECIVRADLPWEMNAGYWNNPEATAEAWRNGWFHTGDLLTRDSEGNYTFVDRKKDAIRRRGENISSYEVEREVMAYPDVVEAACVAAPGKYGEDEVKVFVVLKPGARFDPADLIRFLIPRMPYFMVPLYIEVISELPKTLTMRIKKYELREKGNSAATWDREAAGIVLSRDS